MKKTYCLGLFYDDEYVLLTDKPQLDYQVGKLNGIVGEVKQNKSNLEAMSKRFKENVGDIKVATLGGSTPINPAWKYRGSIIYPNVVSGDSTIDLFSFKHSSNYRTVTNFPITSKEGQIDFFRIEDLGEYDLPNYMEILIPLLYFDSSYNYFLTYNNGAPNIRVKNVSLQTT